jgi:uncharacterized membrane protein YtjA (UPF0391 family)
LGAGFLVIALIAGALGFANVAAGAATVGRVLFGVFLVVFVVLMILSFTATA